jgi:hypothetical protein
VSEVEILTAINDHMQVLGSNMQTIINVLAVILWAVAVGVSALVARWLLKKVIFAIIRKCLKLPL